MQKSKRNKSACTVGSYNFSKIKRIKIVNNHQDWSLWKNRLLVLFFALWYRKIEGGKNEEGQIEKKEND